MIKRAEIFSHQMEVSFRFRFVVRRVKKTFMTQKYKSYNFFH